MELFPPRRYDWTNDYVILLTRSQWPEGFPAPFENRFPMLLRIMFFGALACLPSFLFARADKTPRLVFERAGFSIRPLTGNSANAPYQPMQLFLPAAKGLAPNVGIQILPFPGPIASFVHVSKQRFKAMKYTLLKAQPSGNGAILEYSGKQLGRQMHWYVRAEARGGRVYTATASVAEQQWKTESAILKKCADSLNVKSGRTGPGEYPFSIDPPDVAPGDQESQVLMLFLPPLDGASANVSVRILPYAKTMKDYIALSHHRFEKARFTSIQEQPEGEAMRFEYAGKLSGRAFHWYTKVMLHKGKAFQATATVPEKQWKATTENLKACVNSFKLEVGAASLDAPKTKE